KPICCSCWPMPTRWRRTDGRPAQPHEPASPSVVLDVTLPPFDHVIRDHAGDLHRYLAAGVGRDDADDCLQEVLVAALRAYPELRPDSNVRGWLFTIAYRKGIDVHRATTRRRVMAEMVARRDDTVAPPPTDPPDDALWDAVRRLPPQQRAA